MLFMTLTAILPVSGFGNGRETRSVERGPGVLVDVGLERGLQPLVRVLAAREVAVADEERLLVVVGVDHPERDLVGVAAADLAGGRVVDVDAAELDDHLVRRRLVDDVGLAEDGEQVAGAGLLELLAHQQVGVHPHQEHRDAAELAAPAATLAKPSSVATTNSRRPRSSPDLRVEGEAEDAEQVERPRP